ncbi:hypothetical protein A3B45_05250 [Candidatus Daviesbacteria bacterium RIFCSPLOWO2_01_FULL_39_12]|uniref:Uncharacterized protein n=1 Tax=Candidatus Daviesbacteria bacterium RIFCSPLOWO2_01_FULL_39_12 TaxID=1797785 RepID=A0A1F5KQW1_9BACT|nr:MAG: hypothetical protein A3D79_03335 [Candidatus Daviesbacteria bacterium RIFCSPHIGHO2_02_FULL_39_8]OGE43011.1 MAG: hypothetical protein A3B45_05250 [Candidatus Daviesbacteria bacterium RIFCSPLOWO2_01_FULL_39_12]
MVEKKIGETPDVMKVVEEAVVTGDFAAMERAVNRSRWDMEVEGSDPTAQEPVAKKPKYDYPRVPY